MQCTRLVSKESTHLALKVCNIFMLTFKLQNIQVIADCHHILTHSLKWPKTT